MKGRKPEKKNGMVFVTQSRRQKLTSFISFVATSGMRGEVFYMTRQQLLGSVLRSQKDSFCAAFKHMLSRKQLDIREGTAK